MSQLTLNAGTPPQVLEHIEVGEEVNVDMPLKGEFVSDTEEVFNLEIVPPFKFLGEGYEKIVVSAEVRGLEAVDNLRKQFAVCLRKAGGIFAINMFGFVQAKRAHLPTYPWCLQSKNRGQCILPDLTVEGKVISSNNISRITKQDVEILRSRLPDVVEQVRMIVKVAVAKRIRISHDVYFLVQGDRETKVMLGDFGLEFGVCPALSPSDAETFLRNLESIIEAKAH